MQLGRWQAQRAVALGALKQREKTLALIRQRVQGGLDTNVEPRQGETAVPEVRQQIEQLDEQIMLGRHALAALSAQPLEALRDLTPMLGALLAPPLPTTLPADLPRHRAEAAACEVHSAKA